MELLPVALVVVYLLMASCFFYSWLKLFKQDTNLSSDERLLSQIVLVIATILWPVVVPITYLELLKKNDKNGKFGELRQPPSK